jgi:hypothetical protein
MSDNQPKEQSSEEVDLGQLFKLIGRAFERMFQFFGNIFYRLFLAFVWLVFFTKRHFIKLFLAGILGFSYGFIQQKITVPVYKSTAIIKQNYRIGENLYLLIDRYNALISQNDSSALAKSLNLTPAQANSIQGLDIESTLSENEKIKLFDKYIKDLDSVFASTLEYKSFIKEFDEFDFSFQKITLKSYKKNIFNQILEEIIKSVEASEYIKNEQKKDLAELDRRENVILQSLAESDSLQKVYQEVLVKSVERTAGSQTSVTIDNTEDTSITKEFDLFITDLDLKRELVEINRRRDDIENIVEIVTSEQSEGSLDDSKMILDYEISKKVYYALILTLGLFIVLAGREFIYFLNRFKNSI